MWLFYVAVFLTSCFCDKTEASFTNFLVKKAEVCNNTQLIIKYYIHITKENNGKQFMDFNLTLPYPVDDNIGVVILIETKAIGGNFVELFTVREKNGCKALNKYMGEFWYDVQRHIGMSPGVCPLQQGRYNGHHIELHFEKVTLQTFPFGTLRFTMNAGDNANKKPVWCLFVEVENILN